MKTNFLKIGSRVMMALAAVALATGITSCASEDFDFDPAQPAQQTQVKAKAYISAVVAVEGEIVNDAAVSFAGGINGKVENGVYVLEGDPALNAAIVTVTATYKGLTGVNTVKVPELVAGQFYATTVTVMISLDENFGVTENTDVSTGGGAPTIDDVTSQSDVNVALNGKTYTNTGTDVLNYLLDYEDIEGQIVTNAVYYTDDANVKDYVEGMDLGITRTKKCLPITVAPSTSVTPVVAVTKTVTPMQVVEKAVTKTVTRANGDVLATFTLIAYNTNITTVYDTLGHGDDHGHGHGGSGNAGGGIGEGE